MQSQNSLLSDLKLRTFERLIPADQLETVPTKDQINQKGKRFSILGASSRSSLNSNSSSSSAMANNEMQSLYLYLLQYESGYAYYIKNESEDEEMSSFQVWVGHIKA